MEKQELANVKIRMNYDDFISIAKGLTTADLLSVVISRYVLHYGNPDIKESLKAIRRDVIAFSEGGRLTISL